MKATELIAKLNGLVANGGDLEVVNNAGESIVNVENAPKIHLGLKNKLAKNENERQIAIEFDEYF